jgi:hypothetical protein
LRFQLAQIFFLVIENSNRQLNSLNACVCVKTLFPQGMTFDEMT